MEEAKLALDKAMDARLKGFTQKMIADHSDAMKRSPKVVATAQAKVVA